MLPVLAAFACYLFSGIPLSCDTYPGTAYGTHAFVD